MEATPPEVLAELRAFLKQRRSYTDAWFFLLRVLVALGLTAYFCLTQDSKLVDLPEEILFAGFYIAANFAVQFFASRDRVPARWGYLLLDFSAVLLLRHRMHFDALLDPNATMIGLLSLLLIAYVQYSDIRLSSVLAVAAIAITVLTLWLNVLGLMPAAFAPLAPRPRLSEPFQAVLLLGYLGGVSVMTHRLVHRLYAQLLRYSMEQHRRTHAAVASAVERSRRERLEELSQLKHNFITVISHELRTPITPLLTALDILRQELNGQAAFFEMLDIAQDSAGRIHRVVTDYTKLAELITMDDESLLRWNLHLHEMLRFVQERSGAAVRLKGRLDDLAVSADPRLLGGALLALMRRAQMLTPPDDAVTVQGYEDHDAVVLSIHDPASYLDAATIESLNDLFALSSERAFASPNTGLELILAQHSLRRFGGTLQIDSLPGHGTTVHCCLPAKDAGLRWIQKPELRQELESLAA